MFGTEDEYERAVRGASIHAYENRGSFGSTMTTLAVVGLLATSAYFAFNHYKSITKMQITPLAQLKEILAPVTTSVKEPSIVMSATHTIPEMEDPYLIALKNMEVDVLVEEKKERVKLDTTVQENLSEAMNSIIAESNTKDSSTYTKELIKEIKSDVVMDKSKSVEKSRVVIVKKGDTLAGLSAKFYGDSMKYRKIIASNSGLITDSSIIYPGQKIKLPY